MKCELRTITITFSKDAIGYGVSYGYTEEPPTSHAPPHYLYRGEGTS